MVLTRDPTGRSSGRTSVLEAAARSLERAGMRVEAVVLSRRKGAATWRGRPLHHVPLPGLLVVAGSSLRVVLGRRGTLNEALFDSRGSRRAVAAVARRTGAALVIADGLRTTGPALSASVPVVAHLDDLLSDRYAAMAKSSSASPEDLLGFFAEQLPAPLRRPAAVLAGRLLGLEARRADRREREIALDAAAVAMTSSTEAAELARRTGRQVATLPMSVEVRSPGDPAAADPNSFVFLGLLDYAPNRAALRWWLDAVRPALDARGGADVVLTVVGHSSRQDGLEADPRLRFTGYVDDLGVELRRHRGMVAPVLSGAGVKTKVLDGWSVGLPVVATSAGASGLDPEVGLLVADRADAFAAAVLRLRGDGELALRTGADGRQALQQRFSAEVVGARWAQVVGRALGGPPSNG